MEIRYEDDYRKDEKIITRPIPGSSKGMRIRVRVCIAFASVFFENNIPDHIFVLYTYSMHMHICL